MKIEKIMKNNTKNTKIFQKIHEKTTQKKHYNWNPTICFIASVTSVKCVQLKWKIKCLTQPKKCPTVWQKFSPLYSLI